MSQGNLINLIMLINLIEKCHTPGNLFNLINVINLIEKCHTPGNWINLINVISLIDKCHTRGRLINLINLMNLIEKCIISIISVILEGGWVGLRFGGVGRHGLPTTCIAHLGFYFILFYSNFYLISYLVFTYFLI